MVSNRQIMYNEYQFVQKQNEEMKSGHYLSMIGGPGSPLLLFTFLHCALIGIYIFLGPHLQRWGFTMEEKEIKVDEGLPNFFEAVTLSQADQIVKLEKRMIENFGY